MLFGSKILSLTSRSADVPLRWQYCHRTKLRKLMSKQLNILVFATGMAKKLIKTIEERGHTYTLVHPSDVDLFLSSDEKGNDRVFINGERLAATKYDAVISRIGEHREFASKVLFHLQHNLHMFVTQTGRSIQLCADKWGTAQVLSEHHIRVPRQFYSLRAQYPALMVKKVGGLPIIIKPNGGSKGNGVVFVNNVMTCNMLLESLYSGSNKTIIQEYVNCGTSQCDERHIFVRGHGIVNSMRRNAPKDDVRANLSQNGTGEKITPDEKTQTFVTNICDALGLDFAGVDVMRVKQGDNDELLYCIEVNSNPGELIIDICAHNHYEELLQFVEDNCNKKTPVRADAMAAPSTPAMSNSYPIYDPLKTPEQNALARNEWKTSNGMR